MTLTTSPSTRPAPIASQCASNAPTGMGMPAASPEFSGPFGCESSGDVIGREVSTLQFLPDAGKQRIDCAKEFF